MSSGSSRLATPSLEEETDELTEALRLSMMRNGAKSPKRESPRNETDDDEVLAAAIRLSLVHTDISQGANIDNDEDVAVAVSLSLMHADDAQDSNNDNDKGLTAAISLSLAHVHTRQDAGIDNDDELAAAINLSLGLGDNHRSKIVKTIGKVGTVARTDNLRYYFEKVYREGGIFIHPEFRVGSGIHDWCFERDYTGIKVWRDAIGLTSGGSKSLVVFNYTNKIGFHNITASEKESAEIWASLVTDGKDANAWWGKGVYSVRKGPHEWINREALLDNNFRNMMNRDMEINGKACVDAKYPPRVAYAIPILVDRASVYDVSTRPTPEMVAAKKKAGVNLADKLLNEPGHPPRECWVVRSESPDGSVQAAKARILDVVRSRVENLQSQLGITHEETIHGKMRLGEILITRSLLGEAQRVWSELFEVCEEQFGATHPSTITSINYLAIVLQDQGKLSEAEPLYRRALKGREEQLGAAHPSTFASISNLAGVLTEQGNLSEAEPLYRRALKDAEEQLGAAHPSTLIYRDGLASLLNAQSKVS